MMNGGRPFNLIMELANGFYFIPSSLATSQRTPISIGQITKVDENSKCRWARFCRLTFAKPMLTSVLIQEFSSSKISLRMQHFS